MKALSWMETGHPVRAAQIARDPEPVMRAHGMAIDRLCMNLLAGRPSLEGVCEEYETALATENALAPRDNLDRVIAGMEDV